jgi:hypothetical protein
MPLLKANAVQLLGFLLVLERHSEGLISLEELKRKVGLILAPQCFRIH